MIGFYFGIDHICSYFLCPELNDEGHGHLGANLCPAQHICDAACGYCQNPSREIVVPDGTPIDVAVQETDSNVPIYHDIDFVAGRTYRFRAWPGENITSVIMILVDPGGYPIRRSLTNTGNTLESDKHQEGLDLGGLADIRRDTDRRCVGDTHAEFIYKATETAAYKIGVSAAVDGSFVWSEYDSALNYTMQWGGSVFDSGQHNGHSYLGDHATNGSVRLSVDTITLPSLSREEQTAMLDLQSKENGIGYPPFLGYHDGYPNENLDTENKSARVTDMSDDGEPFWHTAEHPCTWGGRHAGVDVGCCVRSDSDGNILNVTVTSLDLSMYNSVYRGNLGPENFKGHIPDSVGNLTSLRNFGLSASHTSGTLPAALVDATSLETFRVNDALVAGTIPDNFKRQMHTMWVQYSKYISGTLPSSIGAADSMRFTWFAFTRAVGSFFSSLLFSV